MKIYFVMGLPHSGKTTYIKEHFSENIIIVDILNSEIHNDGSKRTLLECRLELEAALNKGRLNNEDVVFEFPGLTKEQRKFFIRKVLQFKMNSDEFYGIWVTASDETIKGRLNAGNHNGSSILEENKNITRSPQIDEGFDALFAYRSSEYVPTSDEYVLTQAKNHCGYSGDDVSDAYSLFERWSKGEKHD